MLIISAGMQKAGSSFAYNLVNELVAQTIGTDANTVKDQHNLDSLMQWNNNVGTPTLYQFLRLWWLSLKTGPFVLKTHRGGIAPYFRVTGKLGMTKMIYIYRDPRDVLVSMRDHGDRIRKKGKKHTFARWDSFEKLAERSESVCRTALKYLQKADILHLKYEDLTTNPEQTMRKVCDYLEVTPSPDLIQQIIGTSSGQSSNHMNKGKIGRYKEELTKEQIELLNQKLEKYLPVLGYA